LNIKKLKILFISPWFPYPPINGSKIRIYNLIKILSNWHDVRLISFVREGEHVDTEGLDGICRIESTIPWREFDPHSWKSITGFFSPTPRSVIDTYSQQMAKQLKLALVQEFPHIIIASQLYAAIYAGRRLDIPSIFDEVELGMVSQKWSISNSPVIKFRKRLNWVKAKAYTRRLIKQYDACTVVSDREKEILTQVVDGNLPVYVVPNGVDLNYHRPSITIPQPNTLIYNGALTFKANFDAISYFLQDIFPIIRVQAPEVKLTITGAIQGVDLSNLPIDDHIIFSGFLQDIRPAVAVAWACVVPLRLGGGTRLKILEAMALGTPVIATMKAAEGICITPGKNIIIADSPEEFSAQTVRLLNDKQLRDELSKNGRELVENNYGWDEIGTTFNRIIDDVMDKTEPKYV
jgi:glycosyltransferase involved in cell wall biosynthesis